MASRELNILIKAKNLASGAISSVKKELGGLDKDLGRIGSKAGRNLGRNLERGVIAAGAGIAAGATFAITTAASFEQAEAGIRKTVEGSIGEVDALIAKVKDMSREVPLSFEELAAIAAEGGALGIETGALDEFTNIIARLGVSTDLTTDQAASAFGQLANVLGMTEADMQSFGDMLVGLGNDGASTESQILDMTARFGAAGKSAGLTNAEILALASSTASMGIEAEAGGGALSRLFNNMTQDIALASSESEVLADTLGLSLGELRTRWDKDAAGVFEDLLGHMHELDQFGRAELLDQLGITNTRDLNAIMLLSDGVDEYQRQLGVAEDATGALDRESDAFFNTTQGKWQTLQNNVRIAADMVGRELLPVVNDLIEEFVDWLSLDTTQAGIKELARDIADNARDFAGWLKGLDWGAIANSLSTAAGAAKGILDAFLSLPGWVQQLLVGGFAVNKLTGGALGDLIGLVGKGVIKGVMNMNAGVVNINAGSVTGGPGGGAPVAGGKGGLGKAAGRVLGVGAAVAGGVIIGSEIGKLINDPIINPAKEFETGAFNRVRESGDAGKIAEGILAVEDALHGQGDVLGRIAVEASALPFIGDALGNAKVTLEQQRDALYQQLADMGLSRAQIDTLIARARATENRVHEANMSEGNRFVSAQAKRDAQINKQAEALAAVRGQTPYLSTLAAKDFRPNVNVNVPISNFISINEWQRTVQSAARTYSTNSGGI